MKVIGVIPARYGSTRLPAKPLALIAGRPLLEWVLRGVQSSQRISQFVVATDHHAIAELVQECGFEAVMTDSALPSGSDRVWAAVRDRDVDVVVNIQGDEPLIEGALLDQLVSCFDDDHDSHLEMATLARAMSHADLLSPNTAKIVVNEFDEALYFSRFALPYARDNVQQFPALEGSLKHIGIYAYRKAFLARFCAQAPVAIERAESLEQLRALYLGARIKVVRVDHDSWGVDTPEDIAKIEQLLNQREQRLKKESR
jgi:3-deoxy-manno-octulosonate cytidylyltransferase (CMP-KDO synthetase)